MDALTTHQLQVERRDNQVYAITTHQLQVERRDNQVYALTTHQLHVERRERHEPSRYALTHTPATCGEEERDIEPMKCMRTPATGGEERET